VKYGIFSRFELNFANIDNIRDYAEFIESLAFLKNSCDENIVPVLNNENQLTFLHNDNSVNDENIEELLREVKKARQEEVDNIKEEIKSLYNSIDEIDNEIKYKKEQIKYMEIKIKEVKDAAESFMGSLQYVTVKSKNSIFNKIKRVFVKEQLKLNA
jgi:predicted  nucleic acid-binding Zn-ribbon protein